MKIIGVKCENKYYISIHQPGTYREHLDLSEYYVNGSIPNKAFKEGWSVIDEKVNKVQRLKTLPDINHRYVLKDSDFLSEKTPASFSREEVAFYDEEDYCWVWKEEYSKYSSLYELVSDKQDPVLEDVNFEYETIMEVSGLIESPEFGYDVFKTHWTHEGTRKITEKDVQHQLLDSLVFPDIVLPSRPCKLTPKQTFDIVRVYIKQNINYEVASITSDYDFCFTVKKKIPMSETEKFTVDVNAFKRTKKKKIETRYKDTREVTIFEMAPKPYQNYTVISGFMGENEQDLKDNIDNYCKELIKFINEPVKDCPHCKGSGVVFTNKFEYKENDSE